MPLVEWRDRGLSTYLLTLVGSIGMKLVIVDPDSVVRVLWPESELNGGVEDVSRAWGEVESVDVGLLEEEPGLGWVENEVDEEDEGEEGSEGGKEGKEELLVDVANREVF